MAKFFLITSISPSELAKYTPHFATWVIAAHAVSPSSLANLPDFTLFLCTYFFVPLGKTCVSPCSPTKRSHKIDLLHKMFQNRL
ncbi:hypothetical protein JHK86_009706 [Glycine max]|nr:hypothetical protein JHK86_009706 [Glycine max]